ncbi:MAG: ABC transporter permease, partial [Acidobacteria bacterium]|nr:ABC transporter permease [Acidobacteriota bacterium]
MGFRQDARYAVRLMGKRPMFTAAIVLTLGVCIGALTAVFSIVDATLLRPLPYPDPDRVAFIGYRTQSKGRSYPQIGADGSIWETFRNSARTVDLAAYSDSYSEINFSSGEHVEFINLQRVGAGYFRVLGLQPFIGREFLPDEDVPNGPALVVLSHVIWQRAFQGDRSIVGRKVTVAGQICEVVGVASPEFESRADLW